MPTPAPLCKHILAQATDCSPDRNKASDGIMSSARHKILSPFSDHDKGDAVDLTHDVKNGIDAHAWARWVVAQDFHEVKYVISNGQIWSRRYKLLGWRKYRGSNQHIQHAHISIYSIMRNSGMHRDWFALFRDRPSRNLDLVMPRPPSASRTRPAPSPVGRNKDVERMALLEIGNRGPHVVTLQHLLNARGVPVKVDGQFGPGTKAAVIKFQISKKIGRDGIVGPKTWGSLLLLP